MHRWMVSCAPVAALVALVVPTQSAWASFGYDDIAFWAGEGSNRAGMVINWAGTGGTQSLAWGFKWDGASTGEQMFDAIVAADPRLYEIAGPGGANSRFGLGYDLDRDGFGYTPGEAGADSGVAADPDDLYVEGWFTAGYWGYYVNQDLGLKTWNPSFGGYYEIKPKDIYSTPQNTKQPYGNPAEAWQGSLLGSADRILSDGSWDGWSFAPGFVGSYPGEPIAAAVPTPATLTLLGVAAGVAALRRRI